MFKLTLRFFSLLLLVFIFQTVLFSQKKFDTPKLISNAEFEIIKSFLDYDKEMPLDLKITEDYDFDSHKREKIVFTSTHNERVVGYLATPKHKKGPFPLIIFCHGGGGSKEWGWQKNNYIGNIVPKYIEEGYAVLALDAQSSGERIVNNDFEPDYVYIEKGWYNRERDMIYQTVIDYRRALDYLSTREEIDQDRIAVDGFSFGSIIALILSAADERIKVASLSALNVGRKSYHWEFKPLRKYNFLNGINDQAILLQLGSKDENILEEDAQYFYDKIASPDKKLIWYDSGHMIPKEYHKIVMDWLKKYL